MRLEDLRGRRVVLLGLGADVLAAVSAIREVEPAELSVVEDGPAAETTNLPVVDLDEAARRAEVFVRSPGFPRYDPRLVEARARGVLMTTPVDLWLGTFGADRTVVAITGTKGKSTVTTLFGTLAERARVNVGIAGNVGTPVFSSDWNHDADVVVLEISSYQAADLHHVPDLAVLTFLSEDHLSWHRGIERYTADKLRVIRNDGGTAPTVLIPADGGRALDALHDIGVEPVIVDAPPADAQVPAHRLQNAALAAAALAELGGHRLIDLEITALARGAMPGRLDPCPGPDGLLCLDDALASNPSATAAALRWLREQDRHTVVLLGGADREVGVEPLCEEFDRWAPGRLEAVVVPENGPALAERCGIAVIAEAADVEDATALAVAAARPDGVVLFSPAAPTPEGAGNWETRSAAFRETLETIMAEDRIDRERERAEAEAAARDGDVVDGDAVAERDGGPASDRDV